MPSLTDVLVQIGLDDDDHKQIVLTIMGNIRDDAGKIVDTYREEITDVLNPGQRNALATLIDRMVDRLLVDSGLTRGDLDSGAAERARRKAERDATMAAMREQRDAHDRAERDRLEIPAQEARDRAETIRAEGEAAKGRMDALAEEIATHPDIVDPPWDRTSVPEEIPS